MCVCFVCGCFVFSFVLQPLIFVAISKPIINKYKILKSKFIVRNEIWCWISQLFFAEIESRRSYVEVVPTYPYSATPFRLDGGTRWAGSEIGSSFPSILTVMRCIASANSSTSRNPSWS